MNRDLFRDFLSFHLKESWFSTGYTLIIPVNHRIIGHYIIKNIQWTDMISRKRFDWPEIMLTDAFDTIITRFRRPAFIMSLKTRQIRLERAKSFVKQIKPTFLKLAWIMQHDEKRVLELNTDEIRYYSHTLSFRKDKILILLDGKSHSSSYSRRLYVWIWWIKNEIQNIKVWISIT